MKLRTYNIVRNLAIVSNLTMWISVGAVYGQVSSPVETTVHQDAIYISLPVFISSMIATAVFTWTIAKYDNARIRKIESLEEKLTILEQSLGEAEKRWSR